MKSQITGLSVNDNTSNAQVKGSWTWVEVSGEYNRPNWSLLVGASEVQINGGKFKTWVPLVGTDTTIVVRAVGPLGQIENSNVVVHYEGFALAKQKIEDQKAGPGHVGIVPGLSFSSLAYQQTGYPDFSQFALTGKVSLGYRRGASLWDYGTTAFVTLLPFSSNLAGVSARFFGLNVRVGYRFPGVTDPWTVTLRGGFYYTTMVVSGSTLGYSNQFGPQLYPELKYALPQDRFVSAYLKFSPILDGLKVLSLSNREYALGATYGWKLPNQHTLGINFDFSDLALSYATSDAKLKTYSIGASYSL